MDTSSPVLSVIRKRVEDASRPGDRSDEHRVCLAVEGGGMRGAVSAGMCGVLEATGIVSAFDCVYGVSAGALNASATATGQAALTASHYEDFASRRAINPMRALIGRPVIDFDFVFDEILGRRRPLSFAGLAKGPEFRALATSLETLTLRVLRNFTGIDEVLQAIRSSAALPRLAGDPPVFRGERMADGGLLEAIPYETALREGATHVLVLRSRPAGYRKPPYTSAAERLGLHGDPALAELVHRNRDEYNRQAEALAHMGPHARVLQVAVPDRTPLIRRLQTSREHVVVALQHGAAAMTGLIGAAPETR